MLFEEDYTYCPLNSCVVIKIKSDDLIERVPLHLKCGEVLEVGDASTEVGIAGCSYRPSILMAEGWVQFYMGQVNIHKTWEEYIIDSGGNPKTIVPDGGDYITSALFTAYHVETKESALSFFEATNPNSYMAYNIVDQKERMLGYYTYSETMKFCNTEKLIRSDEKVNDYLSKKRKLKC